jgi:parallel beta-helix repeat protein
MKRLIIAFIFLSPVSIQAQSDLNNKRFPQKPFVHPGMMQDRQSLDAMKQRVLSGDAVWLTAFNNLKSEASLNFKPEPRAHISVGPYGANSSGGKEYGASAEMAYRHALAWYITGKKEHADKAIEILNAWSARLWDFDDNNAKLNVGLSGPYFLNAAEILQYSNAGWAAKDREQFRRMVLTVLYPTIRDFFTEANGNWDASIIYTLLCIGVYTDDHAVFNTALERFYRGPGNSGITKYIYPNGQIQETTRDWDHVQLGIGEFAKAAQVAWTQGVDLYTVAGNRLAMGFEYTSKALQGQPVPVYGIMSLREMNKYRDIYESVYYHYHDVKGIELPFVKQMLEKTRPKASIGLLTSRTGASIMAKKIRALELPAHLFSIDSLTGAAALVKQTAPAGSIVVQPGEAVQAAVDKAAEQHGIVWLVKGIHKLPAALRLPSNVTIAGEGRSSVLFLDPSVNGKTIINTDPDLHDVVIRDLLIEGASSTVTNADPNADRRNRSYMNAPSREGICLMAERAGQMKNIRLENVTVQNFTRSGVVIRGGSNVSVIHCDLSDNGGSVVPGAGFHHNLLITHSDHCTITGSRFDSSPWGNGLDISSSSDLLVEGNEAARNKQSGIRITESRNVKAANNLTEGNDEHGISFETLADGCVNVEVKNNLSNNNKQFGILIGKIEGRSIINNKLLDNGKIQ